MSSRPFLATDPPSEAAEHTGFTLPMEAGPVFSPRGRLVALAAVLVMSLGAAGIAMLANREWAWHSDLVGSLTPFAGLLILGVVGDGLRERSRRDQVELSFTAMILLGAIPLTGPLLATALGPLIMVLSPVAARPVRRARGSAPPHRTVLLFAVNASMTALLTAAGALTYCLAGGPNVVSGPWTPQTLFLRVGWPLLLADLTFILLNAVLLVGFIATTARPSLRAFVTGALPISILLYLGYGVMAFLFVVLWGPVGLGPLALVLTLVPLLMSRWSYLEYVEEREVHHRLLNALAGAGELRDGNVDRPFRITRVCEAVATYMGLSGRDQDILRDASALHDVGIVSVPWELLDKPLDELSDAEVERVAAHTRVSFDVLSGIDFLEKSAEAVLHHHERYDGRGYPNRLAGKEIPLASRVLAAVDVAEAVGRGLPDTVEGRESLVAHLRRCSGSILDPEVVEAMVKMLQSHRRESLFPDLMRNEGNKSPHRAHARPQMSELISARRHSSVAGGLPGDRDSGRHLGAEVWSHGDGATS